MKRTSITVACALAAIMALSMVTDSPKIGPFGVDVVSAATGAPAPAPAPAPSTSTKTTTTKTSTKTSTKTTTNSTGVLKLGSTGSNVKSLQTSLNNNGYKLTVDGIFGNLTLTAVKDYQGKNGLTVDGLAGPKTFAKLNPVTVTPAATTMIKLGSTGTTVKELQTTLNNKGYKLTVDGIFGKLTLAAVKDYQSKNGLKNDGIVGPLTSAKLKDTTVTPPVVTPPVTTPDVVSAASLVSDIAVFEKSIGKDGKWIVTTTKDLVSDKALVLDGDFKNGKKDKVTGEDIIQRKIGLYTQDDAKNVTARFTLTAPKLTINSLNARIQSGTFKGDLYVAAENFQLVDAKVEGNVYFTTQVAKNTFKMDAKSTVTGNQILTEVDAVSTASLVRNASAFETAVGTNGKWISAILNDITTSKALVVEGDFKKASGDADFQRKIALYSQDSTRAVTRRFTLSAPKLTIKSPGANLSKGIFVGDIYVEALNFKLIDTKVEGNIYFTNQAAMDSFTKDATSTVSGVTELKAN